MKCPYCGAEVRGDVCEYCGSEVRTKSAEIDEENTDKPKKSLKSRLLKILLVVVCVFVGLIGVGMVFGDSTPPVVHVADQTVPYGAKLSVNELASAKDDRSDTVTLRIDSVSSKKAEILSNGEEISFPDVGKYTITISGTDDSENTATTEVIVEVIDDVPPEIAEVGENASLAYGERLYISDKAVEENKLYVKAADEISDVNVKIAGIVPVSDGLTQESFSFDESSARFDQLGSYEVEVTVLDASQNHVEKKFVVNVVDKKNPVLDGLEESFTLAESDQEADFLGSVSANDEIDGDLTDRISVDTSKIKFGEVGEYTVAYSVSDNAGNTLTKTIPVIVKDSTPPDLELNEGTFNLTAGDSAPAYKSNVSAVDTEDGNVSSRIKVDDSDVDYDSPGTYTVVYTVEDLTGNTSTETAKVVVSAPERSISGGSSSSGSAEATDEGEVLITKTGECYHSHKCGSGDYFAVPLSEAKARGLRPCKRCY